MQLFDSLAGVCRGGHVGQPGSAPVERRGPIQYLCGRPPAQEGSA